jgi:hypothetical protein
MTVDDDASFLFFARLCSSLLHAARCLQYLVECDSKEREFGEAVVMIRHAVQIIGKLDIQTQCCGYSRGGLGNHTTHHRTKITKNMELTC